MMYDKFGGCACLWGVGIANQIFKAKYLASLWTDCVDIEGG